MIDRNTIDRIIDRADIVDVVGSKLELTKRGSRFFACCPFHQEKTPSFAVFPNTGTFKCFGCDEFGDSVKFLMKYERMSYPEAIKALGKRYGVEVTETTLSPQQEQDYRIKEAIWAANERLANIYVKQLEKSKEAQTYAYGRWGKEYCQMMGIGYCPPNAKLVDEASISPELAEKMSVKNRGGYDFFSGRITIPIRDRQQRVIGFTARDFDAQSQAKYMNSKESMVYVKKESVFGIDMAWRTASKSRTLYMVEGAPDCMKLQSLGIMNTVAPLGTSWSSEHFSLLKRIADKLCFIPDADPPKENEEYGPGIKAVMKSGEAAIKEGFSVTVKQIPVGKEKQDPDSYFTSKKVFQCLEEQDFVMWMAELLFYEGMTTVQQGTVINRIATLMTYIEDETIIDMYVSRLIKICGTKTLWKKAVEINRSKLAEAEAIAKAEKESDLYRKFGFNVEKSKSGNPRFYYSISEQGGIYVWSNFVMQPLFHIKDTSNAKRIYKIMNEERKKELIELRQEDLVSLQKFMVKIESLGNFIWKATQRELNKLKQYLYEQTETATEITQLGWQRQGFYAFGNGIFYNGDFIKVDEYGIVRLPDDNYYLPANSKIYKDEIRLFQFERRFVHLGLSTITLKDFTSQIFRVFGDNGRVGFMFLLATLFRDIVTRETRSFPILNLFGPKGSGKSELGHTLMSFFIIENVPPNMQNSTIPALNDTVAAVANALVHLDEYKNNLDMIKVEFLKGLWDGTGRTRMNMDMDKKKETTSVDSGIILSGQDMPTADIALFSRLIFLTFSKCEFSDSEKREYMKLKQMRREGMTHLTLELLNYRKNVESAFPDMYGSVMRDVNNALEGEKVEDRILTNWLAPLAVYRCLEAFIPGDISYRDMFNVVVQGIKNQNEQCKQNNELAAFWDMVQYLASEGELMEGGDYRIQYELRFSTNLVNCRWVKAKPILFIQKSRLFMLYKKHGKAVGDELLSESSLKYYLRNSREYLGEKKSVRFKVYHRGVIQMKPNKDKVNKEASTVQRAYCFDYELLKQTYDINLEKSSDISEEEEDDENNIQRELNFGLTNA